MQSIIGLLVGHGETVPHFFPRRTQGTITVRLAAIVGGMLTDMEATAANTSAAFADQIRTACSEIAEMRQELLTAATAQPRDLEAPPGEREGRIILPSQQLSAPRGALPERVASVFASVAARLQRRAPGLSHVHKRGAEGVEGARGRGQGRRGKGGAAHVARITLAACGMLHVRSHRCICNFLLN